MKKMKNETWTVCRRELVNASFMRCCGETWFTSYEWIAQYGPHLVYRLPVAPLLGGGDELYRQQNYRLMMASKHSFLLNGFNRLMMIYQYKEV